MAPKKAGLQAFESSYYDATTAPGAGNPFVPQTGASGLEQLNAQLADQLVQEQKLTDNLETALGAGFNKPPETGPRVLFSPSKNQVFVNGALYDADDAQSALDAEAGGFLDKPTAAMPDGPDWQVVSPDSYKNYMNNIENPGLGTLMARNFEIGGSNLKLLAGRGMQFLGAEETGQGLVDSAVQELYYNQPFQREFTEIDGDKESHGAIDWFVANLAQQGPNLLESIGVALVGAGAGMVAGGGANPFTAAGGAVYALLGKESVKQSVLAAAKKYMKGQVLTKGEKKLLREFSGLTAAAKLKNPNAFFVTSGGTAMTGKQLLKRESADSLLAGTLKAGKAGKGQAIAGGAAGFSVLGSYGMGVADIYGEVRDTGVGDRGTAALGAIPYAALETLPEFFLAGRIFGLGPDILTGGNRAVRAGKGLAVGGTLEGLTELGQEAIILTGTNQLGDAETTKRLINSFAAGFAIGGPLGGGANLLKRGEPTNILDDSDPQADKKLLPAPPEGTPPPQGQGQLPAPAGPAALLTGPPSQDPAFPGPQFVAGAGADAQAQAVPQQGELFPQQDLGQAEANIQTEARQVLEQNPGILSLTDDQFEAYNPFNPETTGNMADLGIRSDDVFRVIQDIRGQGREPAVNPNITAANQEIVTPTPPVAPQEQPVGQQLELPVTDVPQTAQALATPETEQTAIGQQLLQAANNRIQEQQNQLAEQQRLRAEEAERAQRQQEFDLAEQQRLNEQVAQLENARVEQILKENERLTQEVEERKAREQAQIAIPQRQPQQLSLPGMAVPYSARRQALRRGATAAPVVAEPTAAELEQAGQMTLPFPQDPAPELAPLVNEMTNNDIPRSNIQEYVDDFQAAIDNNDVAEQDNIIAEMEGIVASFDRPPAGQQTLQRRSDAVQERSTEEVDASQQTQPSSQIRRGDATRSETPAADRLKESVRKATNRQTEALTREEQREIREANQEARREQIQKSASLESILEKPMIPVQGRTPQEMWNELTGPVALDYTRLPKDFRDTWDQYVAGDNVNGDLAALINENAYLELDSRAEKGDPRGAGLTDADRLDEYTGAFDTTTDFSRFGTAWSYSNQLMAIAFFEPDVNPDIRRKAIKYLKETTFSPQQQNALDTAFITNINTGDPKQGIVQGKNSPWLQYAMRRNLEGQITVALTSMPAWFTSPQAAVIRQTVADTQQQGEVLGQETADTMLTLLRRRQALGETIDWADFKEAYETALGKSGRKKAADKQKEFQRENAQQLEIILDSHLQRVQTRDLRMVYNPVVEIRSDLPGKPDPATQKMNVLFANSNKDYIMGSGYRLKDFFDSAGALKVKRLYNGRMVPDPTPQNQRETNVQLTDVQKLLKKGRRTQAENRRLDRLEPLAAQVEAADQKTDNSGNFLRFTDEKPVEPLGKGEIDLVVKQVLKKLKVKPTVTVVANVQDLAQKNPALYKRAADGRPLGDFDTVQAVGYSVGDQVIIFSDYAKSKEQIRLVVAHEALGHFGFRAFMPRDRMDAIFREMYRTDGHVKAAADIRMRSNPGMDMMEAVEEVLADKAAAFDSQLTYRLRNLVQAVLDAIGLGNLIQAGDIDLVRYFLRQSRRNLRTGGRGVVSVKQMADNLRMLEAESIEGRFSIENVTSHHAANFMNVHASNKKAGSFGSFDKFQEMLKKAPKAKGKSMSRLLAAVSETVQTLDNKAQRSEGLQKIFNIFQKSAGKTRRAMSEYERLTAYTHTPNWFAFGKGPTDQELLIAGEMLAYGNVYKKSLVTPSDINQAGKDQGDLLSGKGSGDERINDDVRRQLQARAVVSKEEFRNGIPYVLTTQASGTKVFRNEDGSALDEQTFDNAYRIYRENLEAVSQAAIDVLVANIEAVVGQRQQAIDNFKRFKTAQGTIGDSDTALQTLERVIEEYTKLITANADAEGNVNPASIKKAQTFLREINRVFHEKDKLDDWQNGREGTADFQSDQYQDIIAGLPEIAALGIEKTQSYNVTNAIQNMFVLDAQVQRQLYRAKQTLLTGYVPSTRRGKWQVRMQAYDSKGNAVKLQEDYAGALPYFQTKEEQDAIDIQTDINNNITNALNPDGTVSPNAVKFEMRDENGNPVTVTLRPQVAKARQSQPLANSLNLMEFMSIVNRLDIGLTIEERSRIITSISGVSERARNSLEKTGNPGWDTDVIRSVAEHLETQAHVAGKTAFAWQLTDILATDGFFRGDPNTLATLEAATRTGTEGQREAAIKKYEEYAYAYSFSADQGSERAKTRLGLLKAARGEQLDPQKDFIPNEGRGEDYRLEANKLIKFYSDSADIMDSTEDILSSDVGSRLKLAAVLLQLGGSFATAIINTISMVTHTIPYLGTYNEARGYGGGFGMPTSAGAMVRAVSNVWRGGLANYDSIYNLAKGENKDSLQKENGVSQDEADALLDATGAGVLQAAQFNALVGTSRGGRSSNRMNGAIKAWMYMFSYTEQLNRRATFLAAYRLERERILGANNLGGMANLEANLPEEAAFVKQQATEFATKAVNTSQGEYAMYNRPEMARGNFAQYIFMYKQFVIISVQLMKGLPRGGRVYMLGMLLALSGMKGLPFADDIFDLVETLAQKFGIKMSTIEVEMSKLADAVVPGSAPFVMRGILDPVLGATFSTRLGFGDLIPLTGFFKAKNNSGEYWQEAKNFAGPVYSGIEGLFGTGSQLVRYGAEAVGLKDDTTRFTDILRDSPSAAVRGVFDAFSYMDDGRITRTDGTVLTKDVGGWTTFWRMLGFYPYSVSLQNEAIRAGRQQQAYVKSLKSHYIQAYTKARLDNDRAEMKRILGFVKEHNKDVGKDSEFYFRNFLGSANRSFKSANLNALDRFRKFAPKTQRQTIDELSDLWGIELN